ncbi:MAG: hypothetical protein HZA90_18050 [Verrucomicrobia bacterium]|nr:hypothetical protein [Verrucomicrobiota bacterium]
MALAYSFSGHPFDLVPPVEESSEVAELGQDCRMSEGRGTKVQKSGNWVSGGESKAEKGQEAEN